MIHFTRYAYRFIVLIAVWPVQHDSYVRLACWSLWGEGVGDYRAVCGHSSS
jgi:hypothetical protein